ncbi:glycine zipper family protein [Photobacterium angustum]|uniref:Glycine zipper family protein n=1 Tax=Photobacterium angustum TaxID=661 RepID=A0A2S7VXX1_PHOAN|nr:glycine zipper family protein [Photobacterium angustum]PQJ66950.1 glycine zipper family protein [Photobacterium angustum]
MRSFKFNVLIPVLFVSTLSACSAPLTPVDKELVVDMNGVDTAQYQKDYDYCNRFADSVITPKMTAATQKRNVIIGTLAGASAFGTSDIDSRDHLTYGTSDIDSIDPVTETVVGAAVGAASGYIVGNNVAAKDEKHKKSSVIRQCLLQKGYHVYDIS